MEKLNTKSNSKKKKGKVCVVYVLEMKLQKEKIIQNTDLPKKKKTSKKNGKKRNCLKQKKTFTFWINLDEQQLVLEFGKRKKWKNW